MITRSSDAWIAKHPEPITSPQQVAVGEGDRAVAFDCGRLLGEYGPGQHTVGGSSVDLYFVRPAATLKIGGPMQTAMGPVRMFGEIEIAVTGPVDLIVNVLGIGTTSGDAAQAVENYLRRTIGTELQDGLVRGFDEASVKAAIDGVKRELAPGVSLARFVQLTVQGPTGNVTVKPPAPAPAPAGPSGPTPGTAVWAYWTDKNWYPATVREVGPDGVLIQWDQSGNTATLPLAHLKPR